MIIDINQKKVSIGDKYQIFTDSNPTHKASSKLFRLFPEINLFENSPDNPVATINRRFSFLRAKYDITLAGDPTLEFRTVSYWKGHYRCDHGTDRYDIYRHNGRKCSIYRNDRQIAWWDKKAVTWFNGDNYSITANKNCNRNLVIVFCLIIDNYTSEGDKKTINIDIGRIGPQAKKFDSYWVPAE
jgi:uncharacterized protein YxjI